MSKVGNHSDQSVFEMIVAGIETVYRRRSTNVGVTKGNWIASRLDDRGMNDAPIVSFLRMSGTLQLTDRTGPHNYTTEDGNATELWFNAKYEDLAIVEVHITGHDRCETERLWNDVIHAVRETLGQMSMPTSYSWVTEEAEVAAHIHAGQHKVIQNFEWRILVPHDSGTRTEIDCIETEAKLVSADGETETVDKTFTQTL